MKVQNSKIEFNKNFFVIAKEYLTSPNDQTILFKTSD